MEFNELTTLETYICLKNENLLSKHTLYFTKSLSDFDRPNCRICKRPFCDKLDVDDVCV